MGHLKQGLHLIKLKCWHGIGAKGMSDDLGSLQVHSYANSVGGFMQAMYDSASALNAILVFMQHLPHEWLYTIIYTQENLPPNIHHTPDQSF